MSIPRFNAMRNYAKPAHKSAAKVLGYALTIGGFDAWRDAGTVWAARLDERELTALAYTALNSLTPEGAEKVARTAMFSRAGQPIAPLFNDMDEARCRAEVASPPELDAYACLHRADGTASPLKAATKPVLKSSWMGG